MTKGHVEPLRDEVKSTGLRLSPMDVANARQSPIERRCSREKRQRGDGESSVVPNHRGMCPTCRVTCRG